MIIDYAMTGICNARCEFCWDMFKGQTGVSIDKVMDVFPKLYAAGIENICVTGGEPLLHPGVDDILTYLKEVGFHIYLSTNGAFLEEHLDTVVNCVDLIGLPIDSLCETSNRNLGRLSQQASITLKNIQLIKSSAENIRIKIGTVLTNANKDELIDIGTALYNAPYSPDVWRIYQFAPIAMGEHYYDKYVIGDDDANSIIHMCRIQFQGHTIDYLPNERPLGSYIFITPSLKVVSFREDNTLEEYSPLDMSMMELQNLIDSHKEISLKNRQVLYSELEKI